MTQPPAGPMGTLVVTAADEGFMPLLRGLVRSLLREQPRPFAEFACFDLGLAPDSRAWLAQHGAQLVVPGWDLPVDLQLRETEPHLRALTVRPFLPRYFPGYDNYLWIDADAWVQEPGTLDWYVAAAAGGALAATPQVDRAYRHAESTVEWRTHRMQRCFGEEAARKTLWAPYFNAGVFALRGDAPHWQRWAAHFEAGLQATEGLLCCDQTALNHMLWAEGLAAHPLPAICNWVCHLALPSFDVQRQKFCEPYAPSQAIGILHLTGETKNVQAQLQGDGWSRTISLRFPEPF